MALASSDQADADNAMFAFENIESSIQKVVSEMDQVVVAVEEISHNTNDIASQIDHIYQQSETTTETRLVLEEHSEELSLQAKNIDMLTNRFKV